MKISATHGKKAISPIIATVLVIAATLIAFAAVAGYMFGLFGTSTAAAQVQVTGVTLVASGFTSGGTTMTFACTSTAPTSGTSFIKVTNTGSSSVSVTGVTVTYGGTNSYSPSTTPCAIGGTGSGTATMYLTFTGDGIATTTASGSTFSLNVALSNGAPAIGTGQFV